MRTTIIAGILAAFLMISFSAEASAQRRVTKRTATPAAPLGTGAVRTPSGLIYMITQKGTGAMPKTGDTVTVNYTGLFTSGAPFDSSLEHNRTPIAFPLGAGRVIKGWDEGIAKMRVGDRAIFLIPPSLAYGVAGAGGGAIPPNSTLIFVVELMNIKAGAAGPAIKPAPKP